MNRSILRVSSNLRNNCSKSSSSLISSKSNSFRLLNNNSNVFSTQPMNLQQNCNNNSFILKSTSSTSTLNTLNSTKPSSIQTCKQSTFNILSKLSLFCFDQIAIIGIGLRFPGNCSNPHEFWENLLKSFDGVIEVPPERWSKSFYQTKSISVKKCGLLPLDEWKGFDPLFFGISPKDSHVLDPQERMMLMVAHEALEDAQIPSSSLRGSNTGVFVGVSDADYGRGMFQNDTAIDFIPGILTDVVHNCIIANRVSYCFDLRGPSMSVDAACSSSLLSVDLALQYIENGTCDVALACGINGLFDPIPTSGFSSLGIIGDECLSFDANAKGFARSEGCGVIVLKRLSDAQRDGNRIYSVIRGRSSNTDGSFGKDTISTPSPITQSVNIEKALKNSNLSASDIYYVEAHATGTVVGDPIEVDTISRVFTNNHSSENPLKIGSVKTNIGHLECASGIASLIKVSLMLKNRKLVPTIKIKQLNPKIPFEKLNIQVVTHIEDFPEDRSILMGVNSFGIGGSNCHVILEEYKHSNNEVDIKQINKMYMVPISGNSKQSMDKYLNLILNNDEIQSKIDFIEFALHQSFSKSHLSNRKMILASDWNEFNSLKYQINQQQSLPLHKESNGNKVIFVFCGQGPQWNQMGFELYESEPVYRNIVDDIDSRLMKYTGYSIIDKIKHLSNPLIDIHKPIYAQPFLFIFQVALFELYKHYGIQPSIVLGHSFGDITAAYCSGSITLDTAIKIVYFRSILQNETIGSGRMLVVGISSQEYIKSFSNKFNDLEIACYNSPQSIVISGSEDQLNLLVKELNSMNIFNTFLRTPCSFHSKSQESIKSKVFSNLNDIESNKSTIVWYSTVTGDIKSDGIDSEYIYNNIRDSVQFEKTMESIKRDLGNQIDDHIFIEISPHPTLSNLIQQCIPLAQVVSPLQRNKDHFIDFISGLSTLFCSGVNIILKSQFKNDSNNYQWKDRTSILPRYQWDLNPYWYESSLSEFKRLKGPSTTILGNQRIDNGPIIYHSDIDIKRPPFQYLKEHMVKNQPILCGTSYVDAIIEAFKPFNQDFQINRVDFKQSLFLKDHPQRIQTYLEKVSNSNYKVHFYIKDSQSHDPNVKWIKSTEASVSLIPNHFEMKVDIDNLKNQCKLTTMTKQEFYQKTNRFGLSYGPSFQHIESLMVGEKTVFGILKTKSNQYTPSNLLNPTLLDSCFHSLLATIEDRNQIVFNSIENIRINWQLVNQIESNMKSYNEIYVYSTKFDKFDNYHKYGDCILFSSNGDVIMEVGMFSFTKTERIKLKTTKYPNDSIYDMILQKKDSNFPSPSSFELPSLIEESSYILSLLSKVNNVVRNLHDTMMKNIPNFSLDTILEQSCDELMEKWNIHQKKSTTRFFKRIIEIFKEYPQCFQEDILKKDDLMEYEFKLFSKAIEIIPKVLVGEEEYAHTLFEDNLLDNFYQNSNNFQYFCKQISNLVGSLISTMVNNQNEKRIIQILEIGGGTGSLTHPMISILDKILENQDNIEVFYTFTDVSQFFLNSMKDKYDNQIKLKSNLKIKYLLLDIEKEFLDQGFNYGTYDLVLMSSVIHIATDLKFTLDNINRVMTPSGWLVFSEPAKSCFCDLIFGVFSTIWNYEDSIRKDHYTLEPQEWCDLLSESNGFRNTSVSGLVDENGNQLPLNIGFLFLVKTQKLSIDSIINKKMERNPLLIIDKDQVFNDSSISNNYTMVTIDDFIDNLYKFEDFKDLIFIPGVQQLSIDNYQRITFDLCRLFKLFLYHQTQPNIIIITKDSQNSNYFANSLLGIVRSSICDFKDMKISFIDIDRDFSNQDIQKISNLSNNYSSLGDFDYIFKNNEIFVDRLIGIQKNLLNSSSIIKDPNQLGCKLNRNLEYKLFERFDHLNSTEVEIEVKAVGLNSRDYYYHTHSDSIDFNIGDKYHPPYGNECSGIITKIGNQVKDFKVGDEVVAVTGHSLSSHVISKVDNTIHKPINISFENATTIPIFYIAIYYSLFVISEFDPEKDSILVHRASSEVGLAALEILKWKKSKKVFVSDSSKEKINHLKSNFSDMILDYYDSKSTEFSFKIKNHSEGVDFILNTLPLEFLESNFKSLAKFGTLIDLILINNSENNNFDFRVFQNDAQYIPINIYNVTSKKKIFKPIISILFDEISNGNLQLQKLNLYDCLESNQAILSFKNSDQMGKNVINCTEMKDKILQPLITSSINNIKPITKSNFKIESISNSIVIIGQKGMSIELIQWLLKYTKVSDIIVLSYSTINNRLERLIGMSNNRIHFYQTDISKYQVLEETFKTIIPLYPPIEHIFNLALVLEDIPILDITIENIKKVHDPKVYGTYNLHLITQSFNLQIKQFIVFSSIAGLIGGLQPSYAAASLVVDSFCEYRNNVLGLPSKSIILGGVGSEGTIAESKSIREYVQSMGILLLENSKLLGGFEIILQQTKYSKPILSKFDFNSIYKFRAFNNKIKHYLNKHIGNHSLIQSDQSNSTEINEYITKILSISLDNIEPSTKLKDIGVDSLISIQLKEFFDTKYERDIFKINEIPSLTIKSILNRIENYNK